MLVVPVINQNVTLALEGIVVVMEGPAIMVGAMLTTSIPSSFPNSNSSFSANVLTLVELHNKE